ncbi:RNA polymerase sigma-70 factor [Solitalea koreensis]|uniref:RNA polymerase sigma-70 factor, ECF subfamily n=1 Tax=Solitalea koreensis TaxID=543615 RepID=A0A521AVM5_9SPHI|nr:RNA polymerase sigma-70 factor [Solitalea koreensis]SMO38855.1 RNA polymerase sigma-70 factor, ECF subfamily [Solitalea koreensis]
MKFVLNNSNIINGFRNGEEVACRQLYALYYRPLCYFAQKLVHNKEEAEDIVVNTFLKLLNKKNDFDNLPDIKSFLYQAVRNTCFDFLRKSKYRDKANKEIEYLSEAYEFFGEEEMITANVLQIIYAEVENLPGQCKQIFKSIFIEGKSTSVVASEMGISTQTVLNQKTKALQKLRLILYKEGLYSIALFIYCLSCITCNHIS